MVTYSIIFLLFVTTIHCQDFSEDRRIRHLWHNIVDKLGDKFNLFRDVGFQSLDYNDTCTNSWLERLAKNLVNQNDVLYLNGSINRDRLRPFFVTDGSNEEMTIQIGDKNQLVRTNNSGEFYEQIEVTNDVIEQQ